MFSQDILVKLPNTPTTEGENPLANIQVETLDHLGLVASAIESLGLVEKIDKCLSMSDSADNINLSHGQRVKAMIINGLGYTAKPLYMTPQFFENKDVSKLIGEDVKTAHLNEFALGRTLDAMYNYNTTRLFAEIAFEVAQERGLLGNSLHIDTTTLLLHGKFVEAVELAAMTKQLPAEQAAKCDAPTPARGYSKAHRHDLHQVVMSLTVTGKAAMPLWFEGLSGSSNDKTNFHNSIAKFEAFKEQVASVDKFLWVADSALYNQGKLQASEITWLTRIPQTKGFAKALVDLPDEVLGWESLEDGYKAVNFSESSSRERWTLIYSEQAFERELKTFNRKVGKAFIAAQKSLKKLCQEPFACEADAMKAANKWLRGLRLHTADFIVTKHKRYNQRGKPPKEAAPDRIEYKLSGEIKDNLTAQRQHRNRLGRFILGSNDTTMDNKDNKQLKQLTAHQMLATYKEQQGVEKGFRFVKSDEFHLDGVYLKLPSRIDALMMVMALSLMVYNSTEYQMRKVMKQLDVSLPDQKNKATKRPTLRWVFQMMQGIHTLKMLGVPSSVSGMDANKEKIVRLFGTCACQIYGISS